MSRNNQNKREHQKEINKLLFNIKLTKKYRQELIKKADKLNKDYENKRIGFLLYSKTYDKLKQKEDYYNEYILSCSERISRIKREQRAEKIPAVAASILIILLILGTSLLVKQNLNLITGAAIAGYGYGSYGKETSSITRKISCNGCKNNSVPPSTEINISFIVNKALLLKEIYPSNWNIIDANKGIISVYNSTHYAIEWELTTNTTSYSIESPESGIYSFTALFDDQIDSINLEIIEKINKTIIEVPVMNIKLTNKLGNKIGSYKIINRTDNKFDLEFSSKSKDSCIN